MAKQEKRMSKYLRHSFSALILCAAVAASVLMTMSRQKVDTVVGDSFTQTVAVFDAEHYEGELEIHVSGIVEPHREVEIASQVSGTVTKRADECRAGTFVGEGTTLLWIDSTNYDLTYKRLEAEKKQAAASIKELDDEIKGLKESIEFADKDYELQEKETGRRLNAKAAFSATEQDQAKRALLAAGRVLTELRNSKRLAETRKVRLQNGIELADARLNEAQVNIDRCEIKAPFSGVVVSDMVEEGDYVTAGNNVVIFEDTSMVDVKCNLRVEQLAQIMKYQMSDSRAQTDPNMAYQLPPTPVTVVRDDGGIRTEWSGMLTRFDGIGVDSQTKMIPCRVVVSNPVAKSQSGQNFMQKALVRGLFVKVDIELHAAEFENETLLRFPSIAMQPGDYVWAVVDDKLQRHKVAVVDRQNEDDPDPRKRMVIVRANPKHLPHNSTIVTSPLAQPLPGSIVKINKRLTAASLKSDSEEKDESNEASNSEDMETDPAKTKSTGIEVDSSNASRTKSKTESNRS